MNSPTDQLKELKIDRHTEPQGSRTPWLWIIVILIIVGVGTWYWLSGANAAISVETEVARRPASPVAAASVLDASGYVIARRQATVSSETTGKVLEVLVEEGMTVEQGQVVARLDDTSQQAQLSLAKAQVQASQAALAETRAQLKQSELDLKRTRELVSRKLVSEAELDAAVANFETLSARLDAGRENVQVSKRNVVLSEEQLDNMTIRAPFAGVVVSKNAQPGEMISPISAGGGFTRTGICTIVDMSSLEIEVDVNEAYIQRVSPGQRVSATLDAYPDWRIPAEVIAIVPTADRQKATVRVRIGFLERDSRVLRDMGTNVAFLGTEVQQAAEPVQGVLISADALQEDESGSFVWRVSNDQVERRSVTVGLTSNSVRTVVKEGLSVGDKIVKTSDKPLVAGASVVEEN
ncbi:MAG: efflux RND transporter periplasmic adaptor subunit [Pseudomonadota bacterium]